MNALRWFALAAAAALIGCGGGDEHADGCPDSLAANSAEWHAVDTRAECVELAGALNESGINIAAGDDAGDGECIGDTSQSAAGGVCRASIVSSCESGLEFELDCVARADRTADCDVTIDAAELERSCRLRVLLR